MIIIPCDNPTELKMPLYLSKVSCGFPSPADNYIESKLDLNEHLVQHPAATFFVRVEGQSMIEDGIYEGDLLIVDKSLKPVDGSIIIVAIDGELTVKKLKIKNNEGYLTPSNPNYKTIKVNENQELHCWGVVTYAIHKFKAHK